MDGQTLSLQELRTHWTTALEIDEHAAAVVSKLDGRSLTSLSSEATPRLAHFPSEKERVTQLLCEALEDVKLDFPNQRVIRIDCERTCQSAGILFRDEQTNLMLQRILTLFCKVSEQSYKQGMNDLLAPFVYLIKATSAASYISQNINNTQRKRQLKRNDYSDAALIYLLFSKFLESFLPKIFIDTDFYGLQCLLSVFRLVLQYHDPELCTFLDERHVPPELYASSWLMTLFSRSCSFSNLFLIWHKQIQLHGAADTAHQATAFPLFCCATVLMENRAFIMDTGDSELPLFLNQLLDITVRSGTSQMPGKAESVFNLEKRLNVVKLLTESEALLRASPHFFVQLVTERILSSAVLPTEQLLDHVEQIVCCQGAVEDVFSSPWDNLYLVDCRPAEDYDSIHVLSSVNCDPSRESTAWSQDLGLIGRKQVVLYGDSQRVLETCAEALIARRVSHVLVLQNDWTSIVEFVEQELGQSYIVRLIASESGSPRAGSRASEKAVNVKTGISCSSDVEHRKPCIESGRQEEVAQNTSAHSYSRPEPARKASITTPIRLAHSPSRWINLNDAEDAKRMDLDNISFYVAKRVLSAKMETKRCVLGISDRYIVQLMRHPDKVEYAKIEEQFQIANLVKITSKKKHPNAVIFHLVGQNEGHEKVLLKKAFLVIRSEECIDLVKAKYNVL